MVQLTVEEKLGSPLLLLNMLLAGEGTTKSCNDDYEKKTMTDQQVNCKFL